VREPIRYGLTMLSMVEGTINHAMRIIADVNDLNIRRYRMVGTITRPIPTMGTNAAKTVAIPRKNRLARSFSTTTAGRYFCHAPAVYPEYFGSLLEAKLSSAPPAAPRYSGKVDPRWALSGTYP